MKHKITSKIVVLSVLLALVFSAIGAVPTPAAGLYTHTWFVKRAIERLVDFDKQDASVDYSELVDILNAWPGYVNYGTIFPDITSFIDQGWAELIHDTAPIDVRGNYLEYLLFLEDHYPDDITNKDIESQTKHYKEFLGTSNKVAFPKFRTALMMEMMVHFQHDPRTLDDEKMIAFLFGFIAHQEADTYWHFNYDSCSDPNLMGIGWGLECAAWKNKDYWNPLTREPQLDQILYTYGGEDPKYRVAFDLGFFKQTILDASDAAGNRRPMCNWSCWFWDQDPLNNGERNIEGTWATATSDLGANDGMKSFLEWYVPGGIEYGSALVAAAWMQAWDAMNAYSPITSSTIVPAQPDGNNGWYRQQVQVALNVAGTVLGKDIGPFTTWYSIDGGQYQEYVGQFTIPKEGIHEISYYSVDSFGNSESARSQTIKIDMTPPTITGAATIAPNSNGWYNNSVTVHFDAQDLISGIETQTPDQTLIEEGAEQSVVGTAVDLAGNIASFTVGSINIDKTPPSMTGAATTSPNDNGWYNSDVTVYFTAEDLLSGLDTLTPEQTLAGESAGQSVTGTAVDLAGNSASVTVGPINIDKIPPVVTVSVDKDRYTKTEPFTVHFDGSDALSGLSFLTAEFNGQSVTDEQVVDLFWLPLGTHTLTVHAEDLAGNITEASQSIELSATLESLKETVARLCTEGYITKNSACNRLSARLDAAIATHNRGHDRTAANLLRAFQNAVNAQTDKSIQGQAAQLLLLDSEYIKDKLSH